MYFSIINHLLKIIIYAACNKKPFSKCFNAPKETSEFQDTNFYKTDLFLGIITINTYHLIIYGQKYFVLTITSLIMIAGPELT